METNNDHTKQSVDAVEEFIVEFEKLYRTELFDMESYWALEQYLLPIFVKFLREKLTQLTTDAVERVAKAIYDQMYYTENGVKPDWVEHGNSLKQDEARAIARKALTPTSDDNK